MTIPAPPTAEIGDQLCKALNRIPGFEHIADHVLDGPYDIVAVSSADVPNWQAKAILDAFPKVTAPARGYWADDVELLDLYVLPKFPGQLLAWHGMDGELSLDDDHSVLGLPDWPDESRWAEHLTTMLCHDEGVPGNPAMPNAKRAHALLERVGVNGYLALTAALAAIDTPEAEEIRADREELLSFMETAAA